MGRTSNFEKRLYERSRLRAEIQQLEAKFDDKPEWRICSITAHHPRFFQHICSECLGVICKKMVALGFDDDGKALPYRQRPYCGAMTRGLFSCQQRVVPGKARCRFHGGSSTGPKTEEGRERISGAQKLRWKNFRAAKQSRDPQS